MNHSNFAQDVRTIKEEECSKSFRIFGRGVKIFSWDNVLFPMSYDFLYLGGKFLLDLSAKTHISDI